MLFLLLLPLLGMTVLPAQDWEPPAVLSLTEEERAFIAEHPVLSVVCGQNQAPFCWRDDREAFPVYRGISLSLLSQAASRLGLEVQVIPTKSDRESVRLLMQDRADVLTWVPSGGEAVAYRSKELYDAYLYLVFRSDSRPAPGNRLLVVLPQAAVPSALYEAFPMEYYNYTFVSNPRKAAKAFQRRSYDFVIVNQFALDAFSGTPDWTATALNVGMPQHFSYSYLGEQLAPLLDKALSSLSQEDFSAVVQESLAQWHACLYEQEVEGRITRRMLVVTACIVLATLAAAALVILLVMRRKVHSVEYDEVTGLPTFTAFRHEVKKVLKHAKPNEYMFISLNIKDFKYINYNFGFSKGNMILLELSQHFQDTCQEGELLCRYHADNFVFFTKTMPYIFTEDHVFALTDAGDHVRKFLPERYDLRFTTSVYYIDDTSQDVTNMIDKANIARKLNPISFSTDRVVEYTKQMDDSIEWNKEITLSMNQAFENHEFEVYYQPKVCFSDSTIVGAEALIRWNSQEHGFLPPDKFVPLFEQNGFIQQIDFFVFESVCRFLVEWNHSGPEGTCPRPLTISFNLSRIHLSDPDLLSKLTGIKNRYEIAPSNIEVELTESILFDDPKRLIKVMNGIKSAGFSISVDDFGAGYSSLNLLKDIPADVLKLDKEFLTNVPGDPKENTIISSVIDMSKKLNLTIVAEGVETASQVELLRAMGCDIAQGYYYARPVPEREYYRMLKDSCAQ